MKKLKKRSEKLFGSVCGRNDQMLTDTFRCYKTAPKESRYRCTWQMVTDTACNMPPIRLREGLAFPRDVPSAKDKGHPEEKAGLPES